MKIVGVVPAAGHAARLQPLDGSKELLPVDGRPVIDHVLDRLRIAGCDEIRVVTRPEKADVAEHAERRGARVVLASPESPPASVAAGIEGLAAADVVLIGLPDTIWEPDDGFVPLRAAVESGWEVVLGLFESDEAARSDVVVLDSTGAVERILVKPPEPPSRLIWGCVAARVRALDGLASAPELGFHFDSLCHSGAVIGVRLSDSFVDIGTHEALDRWQRSSR